MAAPARRGSFLCCWASSSRKTHPSSFDFLSSSRRRLHALGGVADPPLDPQLQLTASVGVPAVRQTQLGPALPALASAVYRTRTAAALKHQRSRSRSIQSEVHQATTADLQATGVVSLSLLSARRNYVIHSSDTNQIRVHFDRFLSANRVNRKINKKNNSVRARLSPQGGHSGPR
jgi:hypothetical protein